MILYLYNVCVEEEYFDYLYDTYYNYAYKICLNILGTCEILEDVLQDSFLKIYKTMGRIKNKGAEKAWIGTVVRNTAINMLKSKRQQSIYEIDFNEEWIDDMSFSTENNLIQALSIQEGVENVLKEIRKFDKKYSDILLLKYYFEFEIDEIGKLLNIPIKTVYTRHDRSIKMLRAKLAPVMD